MTTTTTTKSSWMAAKERMAAKEPGSKLTSSQVRVLTVLDNIAVGALTRPQIGEAVEDQLGITLQRNGGTKPRLNGEAMTYDSLMAWGCIVEIQGDNSGVKYTAYRITAKGRETLRRWLESKVS
jgi:hypothetical protein